MDSLYLMGNAAGVSSGEIFKHSGESFQATRQSAVILNKYPWDAGAEPGDLFRRCGAAYPSFRLVGA